MTRFDRLDSMGSSQVSQSQGSGQSESGLGSVRVGLDCNRFDCLGFRFECSDSGFDYSAVFSSGGHRSRGFHSALSNKKIARGF